jgi:hypothetical protein
MLLVMNRFQRGPVYSACLVGLLLHLIALPLGFSDAAELPAALHRALLVHEMPGELREVVEGAAFIGEKREVIFKGRREVYEYLLNHLDFASQLARALDLSNYVIERTGTDAYVVTTPKGGWAHLQVVYVDSEKQVVLAKGKYGRAVVILQYASFERGGESYMANNLYGYVRADSPLLNFLMTSFGGMLDQRVAEVFGSVARLSERVYEDPASVYQELLAHPELPRDHLRQFAELIKRSPERQAQASFPRPY